MCGIFSSFVPLPLYSVRTPKSSTTPRSLLIIFFSAVPVSFEAMI
nr:MAG TPA: hypothetical protein [Caudoviricetes sp.]